MASVLRESTDDSAPILTNTAGSLTALLKVVLVEGYGTQPPLGFSVVYEDILTNTLVLRGNSGTRFFIKIEDNLSDKSYQLARVFTYESMSDINTGYAACPPRIVTDFNYIVKSQYDNTSFHMEWKIIGDDKGFWLLIRTLEPNYADTGYGLLWVPHYIGDYTPTDISNKYNFMTVLQHSSYYNYFRLNYGNYSSGCIYVMRNPIGMEPGSISVTLKTLNQRVNSIGNENAVSMSPVNGRYLYETPKMIYYDNDVGSIPGLYHMLWRTSQSLLGNYYNQSDAEMAVFYDESPDRKILVFPTRYEGGNVTTGNYVQRLSILIGEGFRNAH